MGTLTTECDFNIMIIFESNIKKTKQGNSRDYVLSNKIKSGVNPYNFHSFILLCVNLSD